MIDVCDLCSVRSCCEGGIQSVCRTCEYIIAVFKPYCYNRVIATRVDKHHSLNIMMTMSMLIGC